MKFKKNEPRVVPQISTASLPDIVFMLLFFFMVTTVMKSKNSPLEIHLPTVEKPDKLKAAEDIRIFIAKESEQNILINNRIVALDRLANSLEELTLSLTDYEKSKVDILLHVDEDVKMKKIYEVKKALRINKLYNITYMAK